MLRSDELLITDDNLNLVIDPAHTDDMGRKRGLIPRDYSQTPIGFYKSAVPFHAVNMPLIPENEWADRVKEKVATQSQLSDIRLRGNNGQPIPSRDQNGRGYCWIHSGVSALILLRAKMNEPYADLSAYAGACIIKNFRDEGGWGAQGLDFLMERGCPTSATWPQQAVSRSHDNPNTWAEAAKYKVTEGFIDLQAAQYDRRLSRAQVATCLLLNIPVIADYNWWGHSVCAMDLVILPNGQFGVRIWNSWGDSWSDRGMGVLDQTKAWPDGATAPRAALAS